MAYKINHADILDWAKNYDGEPFDGILCDPPYELGFMGKSWDSTGIAFNVELWTELLRICKPGAHLLAFSGSRTYHRMACAIEDAGFEIRDMIEWVYGSGFPKSLNIGKAVDKIQGNEREHIGEINDGRTGHNRGFKKDYVGNDGTGKQQYTQLTKGTSEWEGYGTALKPAHEPCVLARKPIKGTVANNCLEHGTGGLNIDGCRVGTEEQINQPASSIMNTITSNDGRDIKTIENYMAKSKTLPPTISTGRFPANLIHDGSDEVEGVFPQSKSTQRKNGQDYAHASQNVNIGGGFKNHEYSDSGSASRFFYCAKASKSERNAGLEDMPLIHPGEVTGRKPGSAGAKNGGYAGMTETPRQNVHPTVKPLALTKYLANLIKPPKGGRLLVPFSGSGSEMIGALQAGWEYVEGVELTEEYIPIAEARIKHWLDKIDKQLEIL